MSSQNQSRLPVTRSTAGSMNTSMSTPSRQTNVHMHIPSQFQSFNIDLTNLDEPIETKSSIEVITNSPYLFGNNYGQQTGGDTRGKIEQSPYSPLDAVPKFDSEAPNQTRHMFTRSMGMRQSHHHAFDMNLNPTPTPDSQPPNDSITVNTGTEVYCTLQSYAQAGTPAPRATPAPPASSRLSRAATEATTTEAQDQHLPPNRIAEAGPIPHPDREWRPYGTNHWHVFLSSPETLKYLSTSEIKEIREHCYQLSKAAGAGAGADDGAAAAPPHHHQHQHQLQQQQQQQQPQGIPDTAYTTADAQAVWKHCDAYIRRRGQLRNNGAARRSRQRKDAELRYWRMKALEYGCPDHEFVWDGRDASPAPGPGPGPVPTGPVTWARARQGRPARGRGPRRGESVALGDG